MPPDLSAFEHGECGIEDDIDREMALATPAPGRGIIEGTEGGQAPQRRMNRRFEAFPVPGLTHPLQHGAAYPSQLVVQVHPWGEQRA